ncbi:MAG TPA: TonB-dependent receptor [Hymenobacter sp.]|jgi:outer membrane receptor protein involved in Fe transport|uniref:TonB-dependent receptor n=1 Tax=Hymenobacter sp. TaxID=1898978 RepID=UPI002ED96CD6
MQPILPAGGRRAPSLPSFLLAALLGAAVSPVAAHSVLRPAAHRVQRTVQGKVTDQQGVALPGATVVVKGTTNGTTTNPDGTFSLSVADEGAITLVVSYIGYLAREVAVTDGNTAVDVQLVPDTKSLEEVVVTGVFDRRTRMDASVAISSISSQQIERVVPNSATDLLRNVPGVYVNASRGEVNSSVYTRGLNVGGGFYYVSLQEDGLPIMGAPGSSATDPTLKPDGYLRADLNIAKVEAVRGGTASILGANAPGGIFNYISKTGGETFGGEVRTRYGLEGNVRQPYYRVDANVGGPLNATKDLTFNVGGFYRYANGPKYPGYPLSYGQQLKANVLKKYKTGSLKLYGKFLHDRTAQFEQTPTIDYADPRPVEGFNSSSSTLIQGVQARVPGAISGGSDVDYDSRNVGLYADKSIGLNWEQDLFDDSWTLTNNVRYSQKRNTLNSTQIVFPVRVDQITFYGVAGMAGRFGTYNFFNPGTGASYGSVQQLPPAGPGGIRFIPNNLNLPGAGVQPNSLFYNPLSYNDISISEIIDQGAITKRLEKMSFTLGGYFSQARTERENTLPLAQGFGTVQNRPQLVGINYTNLAGQTFDLTDPNGVANYGGGGTYYNNALVTQKAAFFGHNWTLTDKLNLDYGLRFENYAIESRLTTPVRQADSPTGVDGNATTLYDNRVLGSSPEQGFDKSISTLSYSAGLNYKFSEGLALYGRYSQGRKSPDLGFFFDIANQSLTSNIAVEAQSTQMAELGLKVRSKKLNVFVTPFYTLLSNVPNFQIFQNVDQTYYAPPRVYQKVETAGLEVEANYAFTPHLSLRAVGIAQRSKALDYQVYLANANGADDDVRVDFSGNNTDNVAPLMLTITPTYSVDKFYASVTYQHMGARWANVANAFKLPAYNTFDLNAGYNLNKHFLLQASLNNVFNTYGILSWAAPGGFPAALDTQGFTPAMREANPTQVYSTLSVLPRALYFTAAYKF